jgi:hypothetical protein
VFPGTVNFGQAVVHGVPAEFLIVKENKLPPGLKDSPISVQSRNPVLAPYHSSGDGFVKNRPGDKQLIEVFIEVSREVLSGLPVMLV